MDINNNQQVNTFLKGMNTDTSDALLNPQQYRYAENVRVTLDSESSVGEITLISGTDIAHVFNGTVIYSNSARDYIIVIVKNNEKWAIYLDETGTGKNFDKVFGECSEPIWKDGLRPHISGVIRWESDENIKFYFADDTGKHGIMVLNVKHKPFNEQQMKSFETVSSRYCKTLPKPILSVGTRGSGNNILPAMIQYYYRLYNKGGVATKLSPPSVLTSIYKESGYGYNAEEVTDRAVTITIDVSNRSIMDCIQIYKATYNVLGQMPIINLVYDGDIKEESTFTYTDIGRSISQLSSEELLALDGVDLIPKILESKGNYLFAANVNYVLDSVDELFSDIDTRSFSSGNYDSVDSNKLYIKNGQLQHMQFNGYPNTYPPIDTNKYKHEYWKVKGTENYGGVGEHVNWTYKEIRWSEYANIKSNVAKYDNPPFFRRGEVYRFGIILYDNHGNKSSVKWIADIMIPDTPMNVTTGGVSSITGTDIGNRDSLFNAKGYTIEFTVHDLPDTCGGYEIVRCIRKLEDKKCITLGIVGKPLLESTNVGNTYSIYNPGIFTLHNIKLSRFNPDEPATKYKSIGDMVMFASPECVYQPDDMQDIFNKYKDSITLKHYCAYDVHTTSENVNMLSGGTEPGILFSCRYFSSLIPRGREFCLDGNNNIDLLWNAYPPGNGYSPVDSQRKIGHGNYWSNQIVSKSNFSLEDENILTPDYGKIEDVRYVKSPKPSSFSSLAEDDTSNAIIAFRDSPTFIGGRQFINWSTILPEEDISSDDIKNLFNNADCYSWYPVGTGGRLFLFKLKELSDLYNGSEFEHLNYQLNSDHFAPIFVANVTKPSVPYGGYNTYAIETSTYHSFGTFNITNTAETRRTSTVEAVGDCYIVVFRYNALHLWQDAYFPYAPQMSTFYFVPIESDLNLYALNGLLYSSSGEVALLDEPASLSAFAYSLTNPAYVYNTAYNSAPTLFSYYINRQNGDNLFTSDSRVHVSEPKINGEYIDNWTVYKPINYLDVDTRHGEITELKLFRDKLMFWLLDATGIISSNEKSIVQDVNNVNIILGTGDVLQRSDYISTKYGIKPGQFANVQSNDAIYWWDGNEKEILRYTDLLSQLSTLKSIKNYINSNDENAIPTMSYDNSKKEVIASVVNNESVVYNEAIDAFVSIYKFTVDTSAQTLNNVFVTKGGNVGLLGQSSSKESKMFNAKLTPLIKYVINKDSAFVKTFDIQIIGGKLYGGENTSALTMKYNTPLKQQSIINLTPNNITNREYDFRLTIPRNGNNTSWGDRMKGKTMQCELSSTSNSTDFSLLYITTKYRMSWS